MMTVGKQTSQRLAGHCRSHYSPGNVQLILSDAFVRLAVSTVRYPDHSFWHTKYHGEILTQSLLTGGGRRILVGYEKIAIFYQYLALLRKRYSIGPQLLWNANRNSYADLWNGAISNVLE